MREPVPGGDSVETLLTITQPMRGFGEAGTAEHFTQIMF